MGQILLDRCNFLVPFRFDVNVHLFGFFVGSALYYHEVEEGREGSQVLLL